MGLCVLFKGITGENFRSNTSILQLPAHSQKTPLSVAGINPTTFRLLVSRYIQANLGRGGGWVGGCGMEAKCVWGNMCVCLCVWLGGWGCCFPSVRSTLHLPRPLSDRPTYITTPNTSVSLSSPSSSSLFPLSLPPSIHLSSHPPSHLLPSLMSAGVSFSCPHLSLFFLPLTCSRRAPPPTHTPLARPPWVSFTSMMPHHYPCPTLSITQQLCHRAYSCAVGLIPIVYHSSSYPLKQGVKTTDCCFLRVSIKFGF